MTATMAGPAVARWSAPAWALRSSTDRGVVDHERAALRAFGISAWLLQIDRVIIADDGTVTVVREPVEVELTRDEIDADGDFSFAVDLDTARAGIDGLPALGRLDPVRMELLTSAVAELLTAYDDAMG